MDADKVSPATHPVADPPGPGGDNSGSCLVPDSSSESTATNGTSSQALSDVATNGTTSDSSAPESSSNDHTYSDSAAASSSSSASSSVQQAQPSSSNNNNLQQVTYPILDSVHLESPDDDFDMLDQEIKNELESISSIFSSSSSSPTVIQLGQGTSTGSSNQGSHSIPPFPPIPPPMPAMSHFPGGGPSAGSSLWEPDDEGYIAANHFPLFEGLGGPAGPSSSFSIMLSSKPWSSGIGITSGGIGSKKPGPNQPTIKSAEDLLKYSKELKEMLKDNFSSIRHNNWDPLNADWKDSAGPSHTCIARIKRDLSQVFTDPLPGIFVVPDDDDLSRIHALITGPDDTPYEGGFFYFFLRVPPDYPLKPPRVRLMTTGGGKVRFNPNLYANGKVCLSILGTWSGPAWSPTQSISSVLMSIQSLLSEEPYHNEPVS